MSVTFSNAQFNGSQASTGVITTVLSNPTYTGTTLTGTAGATAVSINGAIDKPGTSTVRIDLDAVGISAVGAQGTYLGYSTLGTGHYESYFAVSGGGLVTPVTLAVSGTALPGSQAAVLVSSSATVTAPSDPSIPNDLIPPALQSAAVTGASLVLGYSEALGTTPPAGADFTVTAGGQPVAVTGTAVQGANVTLSLATPVAAGQAVTVA